MTTIVNSNGNAEETINQKIIINFIFGYIGEDVIQVCVNDTDNVLMEINIVDLIEGALFDCDDESDQLLDTLASKIISLKGN